MIPICENEHRGEEETRAPVVGIEETILKCENSLSSGLLLEKTSRLEETSRAQFLHSLLVSPITLTSPPDREDL